ncbi:MAG: hypothetical protein HY904_05615, partial [Deltaproteobacteria bacterium]|nr:hypothetical protein [Deltaproteobacteria bacterium]
YNNLGRTAAQPASVTLANLKLDNAIVCTAGDCVATIPTARGTFPANATMRAVALQGYFTQTDVPGFPTTANDIARHTRSSVKGVTGDTTRRVAVDMNKCLGCHETIEGHGGNRVDNPQVCLVCHNPNLSSSGRGADPTLIAAVLAVPTPVATPTPTITGPWGTAGATTTVTVTQALRDTFGALDTAMGGDPLLYPEEPMNFKNLIHGLHGAARRAFPFDFVRDRGTSGVFYYDWSEVTFPGILNNCQTCHTAPAGGVSSYDTDLPANVLMTTNETTNGVTPVTRTTVLASRGSVPNVTDVVSSPTAATCNGCHNSVAAEYHFEQMGGIIRKPRAQALGQ